MSVLLTPPLCISQAKKFEVKHSIFKVPIRLTCINATVTTIKMAIVILRASSNCFSRTLTKADASSNKIIGSLNFSRYFFHSGSVSPISNSLYEKSLRRSLISCGLRPYSMSEFKRRTVSSTLNEELDSVLRNVIIISENMIRKKLQDRFWMSYLN